MREEYIDLCRKLALRRGEWELGDRWVALDGGINMLSLDEYDDDLGTPTADAVWLPREGDWLDLIEAEDVLHVLVDSSGADGVLHVAAMTGSSSGPVGLGPDRLTALARLWTAIKGIPLEPVDPPAEEGTG